jgi:hypothetical protein
MGVDLYMENEGGTKLGEVLDPHGLISRVVSLFGNETTTLLRFIDPYGDTVFNQLQIPVLIRELETVRILLTDDIIGALAQQELEDARKANWAPTVVQYIESSNRSLSVYPLLTSTPTWGVFSIWRTALSEKPILI